MTAVLHRDSAATIARLEELLGVALASRRSRSLRRPGERSAEPAAVSSASTRIGPSAAAAPPSSRRARARRHCPRPPGSRARSAPRRGNSPGPLALKLKPVSSSSHRNRRQRRRIGDLVELPVVVRPDLVEIGKARPNELDLVLGEVVGLGAERERDEGDAALVEPGAVGVGGQVAVLEQVEVVRLGLAQPAAREREPRADVVGLPAVARRRHLDPEGLRRRASLELVEERARSRPPRPRARRRRLRGRGPARPTASRSAAGAQVATSQAGRRPQAPSAKSGAAISAPRRVALPPTGVSIANRTRHMAM